MQTCSSGEAPQPHPAGTLTMLLTDVEGSTKLWGERPDAMRAAMERHHVIARQAIARHGGYLPPDQGEGDSTFAVFARASDALAGALALQRGLLAEHWPGGVQLRVRAALHTGELEMRDDGRNYFGVAISQCARLQAAGHGSQVLLSEATQSLVGGALPPGAALKDLGVHRFKDLSAPARVFQLTHSDLPADFLPLRSLDTRIHNLPAQVTSFIGREQEMEEIKRLLAQTRLLTLVGAGGSGKTRLALQVAADLLDEYADGVWMVELGGLTDPALVPQVVASALSVREEPHQPLLSTLGAYIRAKQLLLLFDNCEHLVAACAQLAGVLLHACPSLKILTTSREVLGIGGENTWRVPSLSLPNFEELPSIDRLAESEAVQLFVERARAALPTFALTSKSAPAVAQICQHLDGIPLAIELAAARTKVLAAEQVAARLGDRFRLLTGGSRAALPRQQTLQATMDWSYDLLAEAERTLLERLSVFAGGFQLEAAETVCASDKVEKAEVLALLSQLVDKSLVNAETLREEARYRLLETIREYARDKLLASGDTTTVRGRHRDWYVSLAEQAEADFVGPNQRLWLDRVEMECDNFRAALQWSKTGEGGTEAGLRIAGALWRFWEARGPQSEGRAWLEGLLSGSAHVSAAARAKALNAAANLARNQGDYARSLALHEASLVLRRELRDKRGIAGSLNNLAVLAHDQGDYRRASSFCEEAVSQWRAAGDSWGAALTLNNLGRAVRFQGEYERATALCEESLRLFQELRHTWGAARALNSLGDAAHYCGDFERATAFYEQSLALRNEVGDKQGIAASLSNLGKVAQRQGNLDRANALAQEALALRRDLGDRRGIAVSLNNLASVAHDRGNYERAAALYRESLATRRDLGDRGGIAWCLEGLASVALAQGRYARAARLFCAAEALREFIGAPLPLADFTHYKRGLHTVREELGEEAFTSTCAEGRVMELEHAITYALTETG